MVAPLYIYALISHKVIQYEMRLRTSVEDIPYQMEPVDCHIGDGLRHINDKVSGCIIFYERIYDLIVVTVSVRDIICKKKLIHDI